MQKLWSCILTSWGLNLFLAALALGAYGWLSRSLPKAAGARRSPVEQALALGILAHAFLAAGLLGFYDLWGLAALCAAVLYGLRFIDFKKDFKKLNPPRASTASAAWLFFPFLYFLVRWISTTIPQQHSDPLYYHVYAPKFWAESGRIFLERTHPSFAQATLWEALYGIPLVFSKSCGPLFRNVSALLAAQSLHFWAGQLFTVWIGAHVIAKLRGAKTASARDFFFAWIAAAPPFFEWTGGIAKTDYFCAMLAVAAFLAVLEEKWFFTGLLLGIAYATKAFAFWTILALPAVIPPRFWAITIAGLFTGVGPVLARNLLFLGNPFFPALDRVLGPGWLSLKWIEANASFAGAPGFSGSLAWLRREVFSQPLSIVNIGVFLVCIPMLPRIKRGIRLTLFLVIQFLIGVSVLKAAAEGRYLGPTLICASLMGYGLLLQNPALNRANWIWILLGFGVNIPLDALVKIPKNYWFRSPDAYLEKFLPVYAWQRWANQNLPKNAKLVSLNEKQNYFLDFTIENTVEMKVWEDLIQNYGAKALVLKLKTLGYQYVHYYPPGSRFAAWYRLPSDIAVLEAACVLCTTDSKIIDLSKF